VDPNYQEFLSNQEDSYEVELVTIFNYFTQTEWYEYFSEDTLLFFGTEVYYISQQDYTTA
jgi:CO dehydrogenase/acetyl-CoA synthase epsilon subunit